MQYWWCNQNRGWEIERSAGVVCASDLSDNLTFRQFVGDVRAGDIVVHFRKSSVCAISRAKEDGKRYKHLPKILRDEYYSGWLFHSDYFDLSHPIPRNSFSSSLIPLRKIHYPISQFGKGLTGYFFPFDEAGFRVILSQVKEALPLWLVAGLIAREPSVRSVDLDQEFQEAVSKSLRSTKKARLARLAKAPHLPPIIEVSGTAFKRNPDVVAEVLLRANGKCELCKSPAPFIRTFDGSPYLEVHHPIRLADGGTDTVNNAVASCPNCHRKEHYG